MGQTKQQTNMQLRHVYKILSTYTLQMFEQNNNKCVAFKTTPLNES